MSFVLAIDQGTTSSRAMIFDQDGTPVATARRELTQHYPADGWVEHDAEDMLGVPVELPAVTETTAFGAACLAGLGAGVWPSMDNLAAGWRCQKRFAPGMDRARRSVLYEGWKRAVARVRS